MDSDGLERDLGANVRALRVSQRKTQAELAAAANVSLGALKHLEQGAGANITTLVRVLAVLGKSSWLGTLAPQPAFNPLEVLEARQKEARKRPAQRVRRRAEVPH
jgi:transcriptional regulator with XRE-family HTH domain